MLAAGLAVLVLITPALAIGWQRQPFLGAFLEQTFIINDTGSTAPQPWPAFAAGAQPGAGHHVSLMNRGITWLAPLISSSTT